MLYLPVCFFLSPVVDCGVPPSVDGGDFNVTETTFESIARYGCNEGFTLSGSQSRTCQADGTWSGTDPVCVAPTNAIQLGPVVGGAAAGFVVVAVATMAIIFGTVHVCKRKRRKHSTNDIQSAYITNVATSLNAAYGAFPSTDDNGADEYNYINPQTFSSGESNDEPSIELHVYDYIRGEFPQTHT